MASKRAGTNLTLKDMIQGSGCTPRTVRYYERQGLLQASRTAGGHRLFPPAELDRLNFIISLREAGWSLDEITALLSIRARAPDDRDACIELDHVVTTQIERLEQKIHILTKLQEDLRGTKRLLAVCATCPERAEPATCQTCERLPEQQPSGFRLTWLADPNRKPAAFDEPAADLADADLGDSEPSL
ncbi:MAG: MerR family transcriptional regulator [Nannocystis sp.]|jgi:DNA-binding transcriptional MerR regulator|nr:MerR family transcriptional regulator [Nannocystis sp.]